MNMLTDKRMFTSSYSQIKKTCVSVFYLHAKDVINSVIRWCD